MKKEEIIKRNISLTFDFVRNIINNPGILDRVPDSVEIDFIETDLPTTSTPEDTNKGKIKPVIFKVEHTFRSIVAEKG